MTDPQNMAKLVSDVREKLESVSQEHADRAEIECALLWAMSQHVGQDPHQVWVPAAAFRIAYWQQRRALPQD